MITKIDTSYQEGNSLKNPDRLENISKGLDKELTALSENVDEILASTIYNFLSTIPGKILFAI